VDPIILPSCKRSTIDERTGRFPAPACLAFACSNV